jgi:TolB-like protein/Tfp pilus assembly protein PilF
LYEMLSGDRAFKGDTVIAILAAIVRDEPKALETSPGLQRIVAGCLRKSPADRFQSMDQVKAALLEVAAASAAKPAEDPPSIAVLPFANMSASKDDEYFSDGLAEEILNILAHIPGLKVTARTSSFAFRGKELDITFIAQALRVRTILEGSVRRAGNRIRVTAQLINAADGYHLWSERYDRELTDVFAVQDEISAAIAAALKIKLASAPAPARRYQPSPPAYEAFLKGRYQIAKGSLEALARAKECFEQAIAMEPGYAEPHAELAFYYLLVGSHSLRPVEENMPLARDEAKKALELDASEPRAHVTLAGVAASYDHDWKQAEEHCRLALAADPVPPAVRLRCALFNLLPRGRFQEAAREMEAALEQDPLSALLYSGFALILNISGDHQRAIQEAGKALELDENAVLAHGSLGLSYALQGQFAQALPAAERAFQIAPWNVYSAGLLAVVLEHAGEPGRAREVLAKAKELSPIGLVVYHMLRSEVEPALDWYQKSIQRREMHAIVHAAAVFLQPLRENPRWPALARMMNLPAAAPAGSDPSRERPY